MRLEPELRQMVYDMVLGFPKSGLVFHGRRWDCERHDLALPETCKLRAVSNDFACMHPLDYDIRDEDTWLLPPLKEILALLLVNKQIHIEALPAFCRLNTFIIHDFYELHSADFHKLLAPSRAQILRQLAIIYDYDPFSQSNEEKFLWILGLKELRNLTIWMSDDQWSLSSTIDNKRNTGSEISKRPSEIPGLQTLLELNPDVEVKLVGPCRGIITYWESKLNERSLQLLRDRERPAAW